MNPEKKTEPLELSLDQLIEEPREEITDETSARPEPAEPLEVATASTPDPVLEPEPATLESIPIPEEELEKIEVAINEEKPAPPLDDEPSALPDLTAETETVIENKVEPISKPVTAPDPVLEPESQTLESIPIPEEELEKIETVVNEEKPDFDTTPVDKINAPVQKEESVLPSEAPTLPEETETSPSTQKPSSGKAQRLITRLEIFQQNAEKLFASKGVSPAENKMTQALPTSINSENLPLNSPETKCDISPTPTLEELETFLFTAKRKN